MMIFQRSETICHSHSTQAPGVVSKFVRPADRFAARRPREASQGVALTTFAGIPPERVAERTE